MKKIAFLINDFGHGGIQKSIVNILKVLDYKKYYIDVYYFGSDDFFKYMIPNSVHLIHLDAVSSIYKFIPFKIACKLFSKKEQKIHKKYDIVIDFDSYQFASAYYAINIKSNKRIMWIHNDVVNECKYNFKYAILHFFMKGKYSYFDQFIGVSKGVIEPFKVKNKIKNKSFIVIPNLIDTEEIFKKSKEKVDDIKIDKSKYNLISVGRLCHQKGYDIFLKDLKKIVKKRRDIHFYLLGDGEDKDKLIKLVDKNQLQDYVTFIGRRSNPFKYENLMDGFVLTSRYEGQGMVILEAKSLGLDIFISKNIEKYNGYNIKGRNNLIEDIIYVKKGIKVKDDLKDYNNSIIVKLCEIFGEDNSNKI